MFALLLGSEIECIRMATSRKKDRSYQGKRKIKLMDEIKSDANNEHWY